MPTATDKAIAEIGYNLYMQIYLADPSFFDDDYRIMRVASEGELLLAAAGEAEVPGDLEGTVGSLFSGRAKVIICPENIPTNKDAPDYKQRPRENLVIAEYVKNGASFGNPFAFYSYEEVKKNDPQRVHYGHLLPDVGTDFAEVSDTLIKANISCAFIPKGVEPRPVLHINWFFSK